jgi:hypothetical protein
VAKFAGEHIRCIVTGQPNSDEHHIYTQKARPDLKEEKWNRIPLKHELHQMAHQKGMGYMAKNFPEIGMWLVDNGWLWDDFKRKFVHPLASEKKH